MKKVAVLSYVAVGILTGMACAKGGDRSWSLDGAGDWDEAGNWGGNVPTLLDDAFIANGGTALIESGVTATASSLQISSGGATLSGGLLTISGILTVGINGSLTVNSGTIIAADVQGTGGTLTWAGGTLKVSGSSSSYLNGFSSATFTSDQNRIDTSGYDVVSDAVLTGTGGFSKEGSGSLTLSGESGYTGTTVLNEGTLRVDGFFALGDSQLVINGGTIGNASSDVFAGFVENKVLVNNDFSIDVLGEAGGLEFMNAVDMGVASLRTITLIGEGLSCFGGTITAENLTFITDGNSSQLMFCDDTDNAITGTVRIGAGVQLELWKINATAISGNLVIDAGADVHLLYYEQFASTSDVEVNGLLQGWTSGTNSFNALYGTGTIRSLSDGETFVIQSGTFSGTVEDGEGSVTLIKAGEGDLLLSGSNSYSGGTVVTGGSVHATDDHSLGNGAVSVGADSALHVEETINLETGKITLETDGTAFYHKNFAAGEALTHFNTLYSNGSRTTSAQVLAGVAGTPLEASASFSDSPERSATNDGVRITDVFSLNGVEGELFVMQLSFTEEAFEEAVLAGLFDSKLELFLSRLEGDTWEKLESGLFVNGAWNLSYMTLGTYGVDQASNTVWAVTNKDGEISVVPEPSTCLLIGLGMGLVLWKGRRDDGTAHLG